MNISAPVSREIQSISFSFYNSQETRKLSVLQITNPILFDNLNHPNKASLYDNRLGPTDKNSICQTCNLSYSHCPGHFGHIELPTPCFNPLTFGKLYKLLNSTCLYCHHFKTSRTQIYHLIGKLKLLHAGKIVQAKELDSELEFKFRPKKNKSNSKYLFYFVN